MTNRYKFPTRVGTFYLAEHEGRFHPIFDDESLGSYATAEQALEDLVGGHTFTPGDGSFDTAELGIPDSLAEWERM